jgi:N-acetylneuraminic acid mutarotase
VTIGIDGNIYALGGCSDQNKSLNTAERYLPKENRWEKIAPFNVPRRAHSAVVLPDGIYILGGFDGQKSLSSVERYLNLFSKPIDMKINLINGF